MTDPGPAPAVSVVVIGYNDADRLVRAVRSVLDQTLRAVEAVIVDDASTDATPRVAAELAAADPERVRVIRLAENSGGCSRPRNVGMGHARGDYVMFLDSDDTLPRHACMSLLDAAEETGADLVAGLCVRQFVDRREEVPWFPRVYARSAVHTSISDNPDQLADMLATNKLYRRDFLETHEMRFPEGLHYEDMLFIAHAYLAAGTIAVIPHRIYNWTVVTDTDTKSISNRRELRSFRDRIEIHRRIDELFRRHGATDLKLRKDIRFLNHDLMIHVRDLASRDAGHRREFVAAARDYLTDLDPRAYARCHRFKAIAAFLLRCGDVDGALAAVEYAPTQLQRPRLSAPLAERDGRVYFCATGLDSELGRRVLDVTGLGFHDQPLSTLPLANDLTVLRVEDGRLHIAGTIVNPLDRIRPDVEGDAYAPAVAADTAAAMDTLVASAAASIASTASTGVGAPTGVGASTEVGASMGVATSKGAAGVASAVTGARPAGLGALDTDARPAAVVEFRDRRRRRRRIRVKALVRLTPGRIHWAATIDLSRRLRPLGFVDPTWDIRIRLRAGPDVIVTTPATRDPAHRGVALPVRPRLTRLCADHIESYITKNGRLAFTLTGRRRAARYTRGAVRRARATRALRRLRRGVLGVERRLLRWPRRRSTKLWFYKKVLTRLPVKAGTAVFESHRGRHYAGNPRYIFEELRRSGSSVRAIWSYSGDRRGFPVTGARLVRRNSWGYYLALARARYWIDDQGFAQGLRKRRETTYIQTWRGSAVKCVGFDHPVLRRRGKGAHKRARRAAERVDHFLVRSEHDVRTLIAGLRTTAEPVRSGYPRNDLLAGGGDPQAPTLLRRRLGLEDGRAVVLYAPTFRRDRAGKVVSDFTVPFDLDRFAAELGDTHVLLVRPHYLCTTEIPSRLRHAVRGVAHIHDVTPLLLAADALVTDYSSVMFDYAMLDRPMIFFTPDLDAYVRREGSYLDLEAGAPGPVIRAPAELFAAIADLDGVRHRYAAQRRSFAAEYGAYETGTAAKEVVARLFVEDEP